MNRDFVITKIHRVVFVDKNEYPEKTTRFKGGPIANELIFHFSGKATVYFNNEVLQDRPHTLRGLPQGECFRYEVEREEPAACIFVAFDTDRPIAERAFVAEVKNPLQMTTLYKKLFSVWVAKNEGYYYECMALLYLIVAELQKENYIPQKQFLMLKPALDYIEKSFMREMIAVGELAQKCGISESYFKKLFLKKYGVTPKKYIIELRMNYACDLLKMGEYSVTRIAEMCGYSDIYFFTRQFKEQLGVSPTEFARKYQSSK